MPNDWLPNVGSQIDRALRELFRQKGAIPNAQSPNGGMYLTLDNHGERTNPLRGIFAHDAVESVKFSGNQEFSVLITDQFDAVPAPGLQNPELHRIAIDTQVGKMMMVMSQSADGGQTLSQTAKDITDAGRSLAFAADSSEAEVQKASNNVDMAEFTCLWVEFTGQARGHPVDAETRQANITFWTESRSFKIIAVPSAIPGYSNDPTK